MTNTQLCPITALVLCLFCGLTMGAGLYGHETPEDNMVRNYGFEDQLDSNDWTISHGSVDRTTESARDGAYGVHVHSRDDIQGGVKQRIYFGPNSTNLQRGKAIYLSTFIKFVTNPTPPLRYIKTRLMYRFVYPDGPNEQGNFGRLSFERVDGYWNQMGGDLGGAPTHLGEPSYLEIFLRVEPENIEYYLDSFAVTPIVEYGDSWLSRLEEKINKYRRSDINITTHLPASIDPADTHVTVKMIRHKFNWGFSIGKDHLTGSGKFSRNFRAFLKGSMFNWLCFTSAMNWIHMEPRKNKVNFRSTKAGTNWMMKNGFKLRGHSVLWEIKERNPLWVRRQTGKNMKKHIKRRIQYMAKNWKNKMYEMDLCNEFGHNRFYEDQAAVVDKSLLISEFKQFHSIDPKVKLCINDYSVLRDPLGTSSQVNLANKLLDMDVPIGCMGAEGHMKRVDVESFSIERFMKRLELIASPGLPITVSELSIHAANVTYRAQILEKLLYAVYSEPMVSGVIYWGVSNYKRTPGLFFADDTVLYRGINFKPNAAGAVLDNLIKKKWVSNLSYYPTSSVHTHTLPGFYHGTYKLTLWVNKNVHAVRYFDVDSTTADAEPLDMIFST